MILLTEKENFVRLLRGELPEFIPTYNMFGWWTKTTFLEQYKRPDNSGFDVWGVEYVATKETACGALPVPGKFLLEDITKWRDVIKAPSLEGVDWEALAKKDLAQKKADTEPIICSTHNGYFQDLMAFMGFTEGLCAMFEEPEEVYALMDYLADFYCAVERKMIEYYKPDVYYILDDTATKLNPFISPKMYRELIKPFHKRQADIALEYGLPLLMHDCGRCEDFIEDWMDIGITGWDPAQVMNDLPGIKAKYGRRLALIGCWDSSGPASWLDSDDELLIAEMKKCVDTYAPGGGFCFGAHVMGALDDPRTLHKMGVISDFYKSYVRDWYQTH